MIDRIIEIIVSRFADKLGTVVKEEVEYITTTLEETARTIVNETMETVRVTLFYLTVGLAAAVIGGAFFVFGLARFVDALTQPGIGYLLIGAFVLIIGASALSKSKGEGTYPE